MSMSFSGGAGPEPAPTAVPVAGTKILLKRSGVQGKLPNAAAAEYGELFINYHSGDPMLCFKDNADNIVQIKPARVIDGGGGETPPDTGNESGDILWNGTHLLVWDGTNWLPVGPGDLAYVQKVDGGTITNSAGSDVDLPLATVTYAGLIVDAASDGKQYARVNGAWAEVDIPPGTTVAEFAPAGPETGQLWYNTTSGELRVYDGAAWQVSAVNLSYTAAASGGTVNSSVGDNADLPLVTDSLAGLMGPSDKQKLDSYPATPRTIDLGYTPAAGKGTVTNTAGANATLTVVSTTNAGLMTPADKTKLNTAPDDIQGAIDAAQQAGEEMTLQAVTDNGNTTTKAIEADGGFKVASGATPLLNHPTGGIGYNSAQDYLQFSARNYDDSNVAQDKSVGVLKLSDKRDYNGNNILTGGDFSIRSRVGNIAFNPGNSLTVGGTSTSSTQQLHQQTTAAPFQHDKVTMAYFYPKVPDTVFDEADATTWLNEYNVLNLGLNKTNDGSKNPNVKNLTGLRIESSLGGSTWSGTGRQLNVAIESQLTASPARDNFNFYTSGDAPNFFLGNTFIGGTVTRNTFELWESTLTEEQKEELAAGALAIPANVETPGDGSFARQWWYDQQTEEDQALIDSGELEYPSNFQAANFTDTFALGDSSNLNLYKSGLIKAGGLQFNNNWTSNSVESRGIVYSSSKKALLSTNRPNSAGQNVEVFLARTDNTSYDSDGNKTPINISRATSFKAESPLGNLSGEYGSYDSYVGFHATDAGQANNNATWTGENDSYGFLSGLTERTVADKTGKTFNFYAAGDAPNYFGGLTECGDGIKVVGGSEGKVECGLISEGNYRLKFVANSKNYLDINSYGSLLSNADVDLDTQTTHTSFNAEPSLTTQRTAGQTLEVSNFKSGLQSFDNPNGAKILYKGFWATNLNANIEAGDATEVYGFYSSVANQTDDGQKSFNLYCIGGAPNYFRGHIRAGDTDVNTVTSAEALGQTNTVKGLKYTLGNGLSLNSTGGATLSIANSASNRLVNFWVSGQSDVCGRIRALSTSTTEFNAGNGGAFVNTSDYRIKQNVAELNNSSDVIKSLRPVSFNYTEDLDKTHHGFIAHELQEHVAQAVIGTKDAEETIGTLTDYDGTVLETEVTEPEELTYTEEVETDGVTTQIVRTRTWAETGTRPVYQGIDQTKLIPLLTKALQEALERIEVLEARLA